MSIMAKALKIIQSKKGISLEQMLTCNLAFCFFYVNDMLKYNHIYKYIRKGA